MQIKIRLLLVTSLFFLSGCPLEENKNAECEKVMVCEEHYENYCDRPVGDSCVEICYFFISEQCWEQCKEDDEQQQ